jgi:hypothetical protein
MLVGYVSDERDMALCDVAVVFENAAGRVPARSQADGAVVADVTPGPWRVTLARPAFGSKWIDVTIEEGAPQRFRLLADGLLGYAWPKWIRAGGRGEFRIHAPEAYQLELWRYGARKELVRSLGWYDDHGPRSTVQLTPDGDYTRTGVAWNTRGYGLTLHRQQVEAPARSGLYYFHARTASGGFFSFPWIVAPARPEAGVAVLTSNITWNAYNNFGGRSNYVNQDGLPPRPAVHARLDLKRYTQPNSWPYAETAAPLSFDRPELFNCVPEADAITDPIAGRLACAMAPAEWRLLGWLEREHFAYDLYSETELHFGGLPLDRYKVLVLNTHPEYWSKEMYTRVKQWVYEQGGKLLYLAGCGLYAEVEFADESTILCRIEGREDLRRESAARLLGLAYTHSGFQSAAPYRVLDAAHWAFAGTGLQPGDLFGHRSLHQRCPGGASGHELDKISPDSPPNLEHLAKGDNPQGSGADLILFHTPDGGAVFSTGSLCWPLSLWVDDTVSAVTRNVLNRFLS